MQIQHKPDSQIQSGTDIPQPEVGKAGDWLFNKTNFLRQVIAGVVAWLNFKMIVPFQQSDGTVQYSTVRPVITGKNATLTFPPIPVGGSSSGGGGGGSGGFAADFYDNTKAWNAGSIVQVTSNAVIAGITLTPGTYILRTNSLGGFNVPANANGNQIPQYPYPAGTIYWMLIALGTQLVNVCQNGQKNIYVNASQPF